MTLLREKLQKKGYTRTQINVYELLIKGMSNKEIAEKLLVTPGAVRVQLINIYKKMGVKTRARLISKHYSQECFLSSGNGNSIAPKLSHSTANWKDDFFISKLKKGLTKNQLDVLELVIKNTSNKEIASQLFFSIGAVRSHLSTLYKKMGLKSKAELLFKCYSELLD